MALKRKERTALAAAAAGLRRRDAPRVPGGGPLEASLTRSRSFAARMANIDGIDSAELSSAASAATGGVMLRRRCLQSQPSPRPPRAATARLTPRLAPSHPVTYIRQKQKGGGYRVGEGALQLLRC